MTVALGTSVACAGAAAEASEAWIASTVPMRAMVAGRTGGAGVVATVRWWSFLPTVELYVYGCK